MHIYFFKFFGLLLFLLSLMSYNSFGQDINQALSLAYSSHPLLFAERAASRAASENVTEALSGWRPEVYLDGSLGKKLVTTKTASASENTDNNTPLSVGMSISQKIYDSGQREQSLKIAESEVLLSQATLMKVENDILLNAAEVYLSLVEERELLGIALKNVQVVERQLQATKDRFEVGDLTITDVAQAEARLSDAKANEISRESNLETAKAIFFSVIGEDSREIFFPKSFPSIPVNTDELIQKARKLNPEVVLLNHAEKVAKLKLSLAMKELGPTVDLKASVNQSWDPNTFFEEQRYFDLSANLSWPLYRGGKEWSKIRRLREKLSQAKAEKDNAVRIANKNSLQLWNSVHSAKAQIDAYQSSIHANKVALDGVIEEEYVGERTVIDVLDAENELFQAQANLIRAKSNLHTYVYRLVSSVGELNARSLQLPVASYYDPEEYYNKVRNSWGGLEGEDDSLLDALSNK